MTNSNKQPDIAPGGSLVPTRTKIVNAAFQLFMDHGYDGTGLAQIVGTSGVSKGAFYHYFPSKSAIYAEVVETFFLAPFKDFDLVELAKLSPKRAKTILQQYYVALPEMVSKTTNQDLTRFYALMFDSISRLPDFQAKIANIYADLIKALAKSFKPKGTTGKQARRAAKRKARKFLAGLEGEIFLNAVLQQPKKKAD